MPLIGASLDGELLPKGNHTFQLDPGWIKIENNEKTNWMSVSGTGIIEAKLTAAYPPSEDTPLPPWLGPLQLQTQMMCAEVNWGVVAVLYRGTKLELTFLRRNLALQKDIRDTVIDFYRRVDEADWYDPVSPQDAARVWPAGTENTKPVKLDLVSNIVFDIMQERSVVKKKKSDLDKWTALLMKEMGENTKGYVSDGHDRTLLKVSWPAAKNKKRPARVFISKVGAEKEENYDKGRTVAPKAAAV